MGKLMLGIIVGSAAYAAWKLSEPAAGESGDMAARIERIRRNVNEAIATGKAAGAQRQMQLEAEFAAITSSQHSAISVQRPAAGT